MPHHDDPIELARVNREAEEARERLVVKRHPAREPSDPPFWPTRPIQGRPGDGNPHREPPPNPLEATQKSMAAVWGIIAVIFGAAAAGWTAHTFFTKPLIASAVKEELKPLGDKLEELRKLEELNQRANEASFAGIKTDIAWLKREQKVDETQPIKSEKPHR